MVDKKVLQEDEIVLDVESLEAYDDDIELEAEEELTAEKFKKLRTKLKESESEKMTALEEMGRTRADFLNSKRRLEEQFKIDKERIIERVVSDFLPLIDSFETAREHTENSNEKWEKGIEAMHGQCISILKSYNITEIDAQGKLFSPYEHEAMANQKGEHGEATDTVLHVLQKGYRRGDTIIRPAKVVIAE